MIRRLLIALVAVTLPCFGATETFTGTDGTDLTAHNALWVQNVNGFELYNNELAPKNTGAWSLAHYSGTFANDQYAQAKITRTYEYDGQMGVGVRVHATAATGYSVSWRQANLYCYRWVNGSATQIGTYSGVAVNDVIRIEVAGTAVTVKNNGATVIGPVTDATIASGSPGVVGWSGSAPGARNRLDDWQGGNLTAAGTRRRVIE